MPTYVYETISSKNGATPRTFELKQSMKDEPLTHDPETGEPVRRVVSGGFGYMAAGASTASGSPRPSGGHGCGTGCGCGH